MAENPKVALYWDFENIHTILANMEKGDDWYKDNRNNPQPTFVDIFRVIEYAASFGDIAINKAYGNWQWFSSYSDILNVAGIDLIQLFPRGKYMKNSADIRMALDAISDIHINPHISHLVIVTSDSDFISLAQKVKQLGKFIAGVGITRFSNKFLVSSCNEFKYYESLQENDVQNHKPSDNSTSRFAVGAGAIPLEEIKAAARRGMQQLVARKGENYVPVTELKQFMVRLLPSFDEKLLGHYSFYGFIKSIPDIVIILDNDSGGHIGLSDYDKGPAADTELLTMN
jgi:uncharacterized LabA/DUF88 family protein